jgi:hypothetical protein
MEALYDVILPAKFLKEKEEMKLKVYNTNHVFICEIN